MKEWFMQLSQRERLLVAGAVVVVLCLLAYLLVMAPLSNTSRERRELLDSQQRSLEWMRGAAAEAQSLLAAGKTSHGEDKRSLIARVSSELRNKQISATKSRPEGDDRLNLVFEEVEFVKLMERLQYLQTTFGISVVKATMEPTAKPGYSSVRLTLAR